MTPTEKLHFQRSESAPEKLSEYRKVFLITFFAGGSFGIVAAILLLQTGATPWSPLPFIIAMILAMGLYSGCAGLAAAALDSRLQLWGIKQGLVRLAISFGSVVLITIIIMVFVQALLGNAQLIWLMQRHSLMAAGAGIIFGAIFALIYYRAEVVKHKMQLLEMENRHLTELASREKLLREAARNLAVTEERNRMARELHDSISQGVHGIIFSLHSLRPILAENQQGLEILRHLEETTGNTMKELRRLVMELSPSPLEDQSLEEAVRLHCDLFARRQKVQLDLDLNYAGELQPDQEMAVYRIVQEALANVQKHSQASMVHVALQSNTGIELFIKDNGKGFSPQATQTGHGLNNMASRARQSGGSFQVKSAPGQGTTITVQWEPSR